MKNYIRYSDTGEIEAVITTTDPNLIVDDCVEIKDKDRNDVMENQKDYVIEKGKLKRKKKEKKV